VRSVRTIPVRYFYRSTYWKSEREMKANEKEVTFLVIGAGAIGGFLGACLAHRVPNYKVTMMARGEHHRVMKESGLHVKLNTLSKNPESFVTRDVRICQNLEESSEFGPYDVIFLAVKAQQLIDIARDRFWSKLIRDDTIIVPLQNGIPWYVFLTRPKGDPFYQVRLKSVDPTGGLEKAFDSNKLVGCIAMPASTLVRPGYIEHEHYWMFPMPDTPLAKRLAGYLSRAGFEPQCSRNFEEELWIKVLGSAIVNPVSALTGATLGEFADEPEIFQLFLQVMEEVRKVAKSVGITISVTSERRLRAAARIKDHKTSMLQDVEMGRTSLEIDALVGSVIEISKITKTEIPNLYLIYQLVRMKQRSMERQSREKARL